MKKQDLIDINTEELTVDPEDVPTEQVAIVKRRVGRPKKGDNKFDSCQRKILKLKDHEINDVLLSKYKGPGAMTILYLDLLYLGARRQDAYDIARVRYGKPIDHSPTVMADARHALLNQPLSIAYLQLLKEGIISPLADITEFSENKFNLDNFKKVDLRYSHDAETQDFRSLIKFYRGVILRRVIRGEGCFDNEFNAISSVLTRNPTGDAEDLKKILWKKISNPYKEANAQLIAKYMELCDMVDTTKENDHHINVTFTDFDSRLVNHDQKQLNKGEEDAIE